MVNLNFDKPDRFGCEKYNRVLGKILHDHGSPIFFRIVQILELCRNQKFKKMMDFYDK